MSSQVSAEPGRRALNRRQLETVERLLTAAQEEIREAGYHTMTVRSVAARASVAPATAYTYFASKNHMVCEVFARALRDLPRTGSRRRSAHARLSEVFTALAEFLAREPELASATTTAMLGPDPDVARLRMRVADEVSDRLREALGDEADRDVLEALTLLYNGAMLQAGLGHQSYDEMAAQLQRASALILGRR